jgi:hypothetical protein
MSGSFSGHADHQGIVMTPVLATVPVLAPAGSAPLTSVNPSCSLFS